jgi:hypothetical protein
LHVTAFDEIHFRERLTPNFSMCIILRRKSFSEPPLAKNILCNIAEQRHSMASARELWCGAISPAAALPQRSQQRLRYLLAHTARTYAIFCGGWSFKGPRHVYERALSLGRRQLSTNIVALVIFIVNQPLPPKEQHALGLFLFGQLQ